MQLLKFFLNIETIDPPYLSDPGRDPLNHPDLARMSLTELADLPLAPQKRQSQPGKPALGECA
jgi:hypothetical protein